MGYSEFKSYLLSHTPDKITFDIDYTTDYYDTHTYIQIEIHYNYNSTYDDWDEYSYAISKARRVIYEALDYGKNHPYSGDDSIEIDKVEEYNDHDPYN